MNNNQCEHPGNVFDQSLPPTWVRLGWSHIRPIIVALSALGAYFSLLFTGWAWLVFVVFGLLYPVYCIFRIVQALLKKKTSVILVYCIALLLAFCISLFGEQLLHVRLYTYFLMHERTYESELNAMPGHPKQKKWHVANRDGNEGYYIVFDEIGKVEPMRGDQAVCHDRVFKLKGHYYAIAIFCPS